MDKCYICKKEFLPWEIYLVSPPNVDKPCKDVFLCSGDCVIKFLNLNWVKKREESL